MTKASKNPSRQLGATREVKVSGTATATAKLAASETTATESSKHPLAASRLRAMLNDVERPSLFPDADSLLLAMAGKSGRLRATQVVFLGQLRANILDSQLGGNLAELGRLIQENWPTSDGAVAERGGLGESLAELDGESA